VFELSELEMVLRLLAALGLGCVVGFEREVRNRSAGMRTHALAAEGAALFAMAAILVSEEAAKAGYGPSDPGRTISTIVQGIGFLAAGVIFAQGARVRGLTTAAGLWVTAAIGVLCGTGLFFLAAVATIATAVILAGLKVVEVRYLASGQDSQVSIEPDDSR
jgi:putative Mg2+ transporter-C (MgtC) family protein